MVPALPTIFCKWSPGFCKWLPFISRKESRTENSPTAPRKLPDSSPKTPRQLPENTPTTPDNFPGRFSQTAWKSLQIYATSVFWPTGNVSMFRCFFIGLSCLVSTNGPHGHSLHPSISTRGEWLTNATGIHSVVACTSANFSPPMLCYYCSEFRKWQAKLESIGDLFLNLLAMPRCDGFTTGGSAATH